MSELDGFVIYKPKRGARIHITVRKRCVGITQAAIDALGNTEYINVFFDDRKHRVMIKRAEEGYENTLKICPNGTSGLTINSKVIAEKLRGWYGNDAQIPGHTAGDGILIFEVMR